MTREHLFGIIKLNKRSGVFLFVPNTDKTYFCIDMKSFFASVECAERGLNPFETRLVVVDETRGKGAICLAVTPKLKEDGVPNRCRLFQIPEGLEYICAKPRMRKYIEYASEIYAIYLKYVDKNDIHVYSIDECFLDVTDYVKLYKTTKFEFAKKLMNEIWSSLGVPSTVGIGTNLFLSKIALDITAKKTTERIGFLDEELFKKTLWHHKPITDFWQISFGTAKRLAKMGISDLYEITRYPERLLYKEFGINAELLIDHANGIETCTIKDIKNYKSKSKSISSSQILFEDYTFDKARIVLGEMVRDGAYELIRQKLVTSSVNFFIGYSDNQIPPTKVHVKLLQNTNLSSIMYLPIIKAFDENVIKGELIRRLGIDFNDLLDEKYEKYDLFTKTSEVSKLKRVENEVVLLKERFGKNSMLRGADLQAGATAKIRNGLIGGHNGE